MSDEYGIGSMSGKRVPKSQQRAMLEHLRGAELDAKRRLGKAGNYESRRRAETDLEGVQSMKHKVLSWDVEDD